MLNYIFLTLSFIVASLVSCAIVFLITTSKPMQNLYTKMILAYAEELDAKLIEAEEE